MPGPEHTPKGAARSSGTQPSLTDLALEQGGLGVWFWDIALDKVTVHPALLRLLDAEGSDNTRPMGAWAQYLHPDDKSPAAERWASHVAGETPTYEAVFRAVCPEGSHRHLLVRGAVVERDPAGQPLLAVGTCVDITRRAAAEESLRRSEMSLAMANEAAGLGHWRWHIPTRAVHWSPETFRILGYAPGEVEPHEGAYRDCVCAQDLSAVEDELARALAEPGYVYDVRQRVRANGSERVVRSVGRMVEWDAEGEPLLMVGTVQDVTETARALEELERSRHQLDLHNRIIRTFLTESGAALYAGVLDIVRDMLDSPLGYFGYIDHEGSLVSESMTQDIWDRCQIPDKAVVFRRDCWSGIWGDSLQRKVTRVSNGPFHTPQGHLPLHCAIAVPIIYHGELVGQVVLANKPGGYAEYDRERLEGIADLVAPILKSRLEAERHEREREQLHAQLQLRRRLEALGTLAGGIAHDFNNMLGAILGHAEMAAERLPEDSEEHDHLARVGAAAERAAQLVAKILAFSQQAEGEARPTRIEAVITETIELLKPAVPRHVHVSVQASGDLPAVLVDPSQLHQVILNLCTNALYAMREKGGALRIGAETAHLTEADGERLGVPAPGEYVRMSVADTGTGIPEEIRDRVFDPFFSSKPVGEGTGMGLSTAHGIIASHGGAIALESELGEGTTFHVYLPTTTERPIEEQVAREQAGSRPARILLVDDEASMVEVAQQLLSVLGYEVECFTDPARALDALGTDPAGFDIVLTDLTMPDISGMDVAETAKGLNAGIHVVLMTGFSVSSYLDVSENPVVDGFLQKPFGKRKLAEVLAGLGR